MSELGLKGRRAFVTGSFQGIGLGIATALAKDGADIVLHGLASEEVIAKAEAAVKSAGAGKVESKYESIPPVRSNLQRSPCWKLN